MENNTATHVYITHSAEKEIKKIPTHIVLKLRHWIKSVEENGIDRVQLVKSWRDEQLKGNRLGQRSIRLNQAYRAIYIVGSSIKITIIEVNKHDY
ncbi:MAG: toxin HigB [Euryarchaeota archaeon]|jgi:proteic killer suppression protein|nr:toxin HigB [Euryarchaeota archaeon]